MQLGGAALGGAAGVAAGSTLGNRAGTPGNRGGTPDAAGINAPLDPGVTRVNSDPQDRGGQSAAQVAAANPQGNVFRADARTAATNPRELAVRSHSSQRPFLLTLPISCTRAAVAISAPLRSMAMSGTAFVKPLDCRCLF